MCNLLEYSKNCIKTTGSLWNCYRDQPNSNIGDSNITHSILNSESFDYKANFMENGVTHDNLTKNDVKIVVPIKHLSNFWRHLDIPLINCEVELILTWFKNCVLIDKSTREADYNADPNVYEINNPEDATFKITDVKLFVPVVTLTKQNDIKLLEQLKTGFKRTIKWNKYRSQMSIQPQNNNLNYLIAQHLQMLIDYLFYVSQEIIMQIVDILFQITMYLKLKSMSLMFSLMENFFLIYQ